MLNPIVIKFYLPEHEFVNAMRTYNWKTKWTGRDLFISISILMTCIWSWGTFGLSATNIFCMIAAGVYLFIGNWILSELPKRQYQQQPHFHHPMAMWFSDEAIISTNGKEETRIDWSHYKETIETRMYFFMKYNKDSYTVVPKRVFPTYAQMEAYRLLVESKMPIQKWK